ncbi:S-(hydroxymethyl)mycothiol dehydrogenase, partial [Streptomyces sp. 2MCAF27]
CGVCHTDLHYREGGINDEFPFLLGHEAAGVVESVGEGVTEVAPGDFVILNWRAVCGQCRACLRGRPWYCFNTHNARQKMTLTDGTELSPALGIGAFAEKTLVAAGQCTKVDPAASPAAAGLLGCGVMAGLGAAINTGAVGRGDSVAVIGCGGVGGAAIAGSRLAGASKIIAVDVDDRKLEMARTLGATHTVNGKTADTVEAIQQLTGGHGADVVIDAVGRPETYRQAFYARDLAGTVVLVGVPTPEMKLELPLLDVFGRGGALKSSWYGDCLPSRDFPMLIDLYLQGRLDLDAFVSETIGLD